MTEATCSEPGCERRAESRRGMCGKHYQRVWKQERACSVAGCDRPYAAKSLCSMHYKRQRKGQSFDAPPLGAGKAAGCSIEGCDRPYHSNGYCGVHAQRVRRTGDPEAPVRTALIGCRVPDCQAQHFARGYCNGHYKRIWRGSNEDRECRLCGASFARPLGRSGSYDYCPSCDVTGPVAWAALRRARLAANNVGMTVADRATAAEYRVLIAADPCVFCGGESEAVDHIHPVVRGGSDRWTNLAPICQSCNSIKRDRSLLEVLLPGR